MSTAPAIELDAAIRAYVAANDLAVSISHHAFASQEYRDAAEARRRAERFVVHLLKRLGTAHAVDGYRWALDTVGELCKARVETRPGKFHRPPNPYRHFNNRKVRS